MPSSSGAVLPLDPYQCLSKPKRNYASECREVYLTGQGAETLSERFSHFTNLEVLWLTGNRLSHLNDLELNIRVREVYVQNNRLVSLQGLRTFKFLTTLQASNNQLRNLDKQLSVLSRFAFLRKLDLFDNPAAEEPDYRLRAIYALPQVEVLDKRSVKHLERERAEEVVPNIDKVSAARVEPPKKRAPKHSAMELDAFREAAANRDRRQREQDKQVLMFTLASTVDPSAPLPRARAVAEQRRQWEDPSHLQVEREKVQPSPWEQAHMRPLIEKRAGKDTLSKDEVVALAKDLAGDGIEEVGRVLGDLGSVGLSPDGNQTRRLSRMSRMSATTTQPATALDRLFEDRDPEAEMPVGEVAGWLLKLEWPHYDDDSLDKRISRLHDESQAAKDAGDADAHDSKRMTALRLEGAKTRKQLVPGLHRDQGPQGGPRRKQRADLFSMTFNKGTREVDEETGQVRVKVKQESRAHPIGCY